ncbi:hypothetical protein MST22_11735 [Virgibacillus halodenitrificans]|uniref:hypothetical protein n=1 Tax=Virgibacillus halodenitrificans TaxID=1482 RepID=UPI001FB2E169|nr:hypothetical protein [Virgibacillus halodenitrificans]MCJ0931825.1 hypothetical protein [Virgibacillus halodenitrificans]
MKIKSVVATTHVDKHNTRITKEALEEMAQDLKNSGKVPAFNIEHDSILPPIGKVIDGWVEKREDGEFQFITISEIFEKKTEIRLPDNSLAYIEASETDDRPFSLPETEEIFREPKIYVDLANFPNEKEYEKFKNEIKEVGKFKDEIIGRKSFIPDPEIIITITQYVMGSAIGNKIFEKLTDRVADDVSTTTYEVIKKAVTSIANYAIPKSRPITYIFLIPGEINIELAIRTNNPKLAINAISQDKINDVLEKVESYLDILDISKIQFLYDTEEEWQFNFLLTKKGEVIGAPISHKKRAKKIELLGFKDFKE